MLGTRSIRHRLVALAVVSAAAVTGACGFANGAALAAPSPSVITKPSVVLTFRPVGDSPREIKAIKIKQVRGSFERCVAVDAPDRAVSVKLIANITYEVTSYAEPGCYLGFQYAGGQGYVNSSTATRWAVFNGMAPRPDR